MSKAAMYEVRTAAIPFVVAFTGERDSEAGLTPVKVASGTKVHDVVVCPHDSTCLVGYIDGVRHEFDKHNLVRC